MLGYANILEKFMTYSVQRKQKLTDSEWNEMNALREAINEYPQSVHPEKMEEFTEYLVRSLREKGG